jgi:GMP reductase
MTKDFLLSYDTVCLRPKHSYLKSRDEANTSVNFLGRTFKLPVVPANMIDVISIDNAKWLSENDYFYIMHRFDNTTKDFITKSNLANFKSISISVGTTDYKDIVDFSLSENFRLDFITLDVAHGDHENVEETVGYIRKYLPNTKLIVGNIATNEAVAYLADLKVDAIKVGIGGGSICTTRYQTGFHLPTLHSVFEIKKCLVEISRDIPIIADGGAKYYGDIAKALTLGATMVMSGGWFASCIDSPAKIIGGKKVYRGSTSYEAKGINRHIEGRTLELEEGLTYSQRLSEIQQALQSSISYAGGKDLSSFGFVDWERILPYH